LHNTGEKITSEV